MRVALIDYGAGNLASVRKALTAVGADVHTPATADALDTFAAIVVPGVGHFNATATLQGSWRDRIRATIDQGVPLLGICLGLQWLFEGSAEAPDVRGLGLVDGQCTRLSGTDEGNRTAGTGRATRLKIPHVGWNALRLVRPSWLFDGVSDGAYVYFTHAYAAPVTEVTTATTTYGETFASALERGRVGAVQFHPEKSGDVGLRILRNFLALTETTAAGDS